MVFYLLYHLELLLQIILLAKNEKKIAILGSTGSIGKTTLKIINKNKSIIVDLLSTNTN